MQKQVMKLTFTAALLSLFAGSLHAGDSREIDVRPEAAKGAGIALEVEPESGRGGEAMRELDPTAFRVCADVDNLPYSNNKQEGFENKIAELIAKDLGKRLEYQFWVDRFGFVRNTINARRCDVMIGTVAGNDMLLTTRPYYRSGYVFVYRKDSGLKITDWDSPDLKKVKIGTVDKTPPSRPLSDKELLGNTKPYRIYRDLTVPPGELVDDVVKGVIDVAIVWGPIAGYYVKQSKVPLEVVLAPEYEQENPGGKINWNISMAVRKKDNERLAVLQEVIDRRHADIMKILDEYGIPHIPVVAEKKKGPQEKRGDAIPKFD